MPFIDLSNTSSPVAAASQPKPDAPPPTAVPQTNAPPQVAITTNQPVTAQPLVPPPPLVAAQPVAAVNLNSQPKPETAPVPNTQAERNVTSEFQNNNSNVDEIIPNLKTEIAPPASLTPAGLKGNQPSISSSPSPVTPTPSMAASGPALPELPQLDPAAPGLQLEGNNQPTIATTAGLSAEAETEEENDLADLPVSELNSLNIPERLTNKTTLDPNIPSPNKKVELTIDDSGVKTITGPELPANTTAVPKPEMPIAPIPAEAPIVTAQMQESNELKTGVSNTEMKYSGGILPSNTEMETLMNIAEEQLASDIHFAANYPVMLRVHGKLQELTQPISPEQAKELGDQLLSPARKEQFAKNLEIDFSFTSEKNTRFRVNLFTERSNTAGALRLIAKNIRTMDELGLPDIFKDIVEEPHGLVLLVGPTGSGKSTTLAAMINYINLNRSEHIVTIEDPIEYVYPVGKSIVNQRELEADTQTWNNALRSALREDPNVVLVGEMRDLSTIESTITIAETGHLTFATLHTNSAAQAVDRIIDVFPEGAKEQIRAQLANVITAVISQRLIPIAGGGRRAAIEVMLGTVAVRNAIREGKTYQIDNIIQTSGDLGMLTLEKSLVEMINAGYIDRDTAKMYTTKPEEIDSLISKT